MQPVKPSKKTITIVLVLQELKSDLPVHWRATGPIGKCFYIEIRMARCGIQMNCVSWLYFEKLVPTAYHEKMRKTTFTHFTTPQTPDQSY